MPKKPHDLLKSILTIIFSGVCAGAAAIGVAQSMVYTRGEGIALQNKVTEVERNYREDLKEVRERLDRILEEVKKR